MAYIFGAGAVAGVMNGGGDWTDYAWENRWPAQRTRPDRVEWRTAAFPLPDVINMYRLCVSERLKTLIEEFQPGVHDFHPVELKWRDFEHSENRFWLAVGDRADVLSDRYSKRNRWGHARIGEGAIDHRLVVDRALVEGRHLWETPRTTYGADYMISDALAEAMQAREITGTYLSRLDETDENGRYRAPPRSMNRVYELVYDDRHGVAWTEKALDGDIEAVEPAVYGPLRWRYPKTYAWGVPVHRDHLPTRILYGAARRMPADLSWATDFWTVSDRMRALIEAFEPGLHGFYPVDYFSRRKQFVERRFILNICQFIDAGNPALSTILRNKRGTYGYGEYWSNPRGERGDLVFDRDRINGAHLWLDPASFGPPKMMMSAELAEAFGAAKLTSVHFRPYQLV